MKNYSIAEARDRFAAIIQEIERTDAVQISRRGAPVAVIVPIAEYRRLQAGKQEFWTAYDSFRARFDLAEAAISQDVFSDVRDSSPGREIVW